MILSFAELLNQNQPSYDYCVVGTGPAGTTLALALSGDSGKRVLLVEGGREDFDDQSQELYTGSSSGREYADLDATRLRQLGGSSNHWSGYCLPLSDHDYDRDELDGIDPWPISSDQIRRYSRQASDILELPVFGRDSDKSILPGSDGLFRVAFGGSSRVNFGEKYKDKIGSSKNIDLVLGANLVELFPAPETGRIVSAELASLDGRLRIRVSAEVFSICLGGIENPRMLLNSNSVIENGLGNERDLVGRYFADHLHLEFGWYVAFDPDRISGLSNGKFIEPVPLLLENGSLLNFGWEAEPAFPHNVADHIVADFKEIACASSIFRDLTRLTGRDIFCRRIKRPTVGRLRLVAECMPDFESRVSLGTQLDRFGKRKVDLHWKIHEADRHTYNHAAVSIAQFFIRNNLGRIKVEPWVLDLSMDWPGRTTHELYGHHHIGTTKMGSSPSNGVVDMSCRVFGHDNLFVCGSSTFPRGGYANPTYTIVELALYLADEIKRLQ
ncbi:MAG: GMC family oxidoreductase [Minwuia sp.]|nr:GMC family oxidoreductase [Minwuia sp.]